MNAVPAVVHREGKIYTLDREGGRSVYGEPVVEISGRKYREWVVWRSKLCSLMKKTELDLPKEANILYLGAAQGTTVSHISDILEKGMIYAVEFSETAYRKLATLSAKRNNIFPILEDAFHPERFRPMVPAVDILYQDVSQKEQLRLFLMNSDIFLKKGGKGILMLKARSVDVTARPDKIYERTAGGLRAAGLKVEQMIELDPFQVDHAAFIIGK